MQSDACGVEREKSKFLQKFPRVIFESEVRFELQQQRSEISTHKKKKPKPACCFVLNVSRGAPRSRTTASLPSGFPRVPVLFCYSIRFSCHQQLPCVMFVMSQPDAGWTEPRLRPCFKSFTSLQVLLSLARHYCLPTVTCLSLFSLPVFL